MSKKLIASISSIVAVIVVTILAVAATSNPTPAQAQQKAQTGTVQTQRNVVPVSAQAPQRMAANSPMQEIMGCNFSDLMLDENGELVSKAVFEANIEKEIANGNFNSEDKEFLLEMYDTMSGGEGCVGFGGCPYGR